MNQKSPENNLTLPLLITRGLVVFPNMSEEIEASRPFSVAAIKDAKEMTNSLIFVVAQKTPDVDNPKEEDIYDVGTLCRIVSYADNGSSMRIRLIGSKRVKFLKTVLGENPPAEGTFLESDLRTDICLLATGRDTRGCDIWVALGPALDSTCCPPRPLPPTGPPAEAAASPQSAF